MAKFICSNEQNEKHELESDLSIEFCQPKTMKMIGRILDEFEESNYADPALTDKHAALYSYAAKLLLPVMEHSFFSYDTKEKPLSNTRIFKVVQEQLDNFRIFIDYNKDLLCS